MVIQIRDDRRMRALTGLSQNRFDALLTEFTVPYEERLESLLTGRTCP